MDQINPNKLKTLGLFLVSLLFLITDWVLINIALYRDQDLLYWIWPTASMALTIVFLTFFGSVNRNRYFLYALSALSLLSYIYVFPRDWFVLTGGVVFACMLFWFENRIRAEERYRQDFSIRRVSSSSISYIIYGFLLLISLNIYHNTSQDFRDHPESFYEALGRSAARSARYLSGGEKIGIDFNQTLDQYLETQSREHLPNYEDLPDIQRQQFLNEARDQFFRQYGGANQDGSQPLSEIIANFAVERVRAVAESKPQLFPVIFTVIVLALMRTFAFIFRYLTVGFTWIFFRLLLSIGFFKLIKVPVEVEKLEI